MEVHQVHQVHQGRLDSVVHHAFLNHGSVMDTPTAKTVRTSQMHVRTEHAVRLVFSAQTGGAFHFFGNVVSLNSGSIYNSKQNIKLIV